MVVFDFTCFCSAIIIDFCLCLLYFYWIFGFLLFLSLSNMWFFLLHYTQRLSLRAVADFKAITCPPPQRFIKCKDIELRASPAIALIQCWGIVLFIFQILSTFSYVKFFIHFRLILYKSKSGLTFWIKEIELLLIVTRQHNSDTT